MFPPFVLAKIYVQGSLKNTEKGFEFNLKNVVDSGTLVELGPITVDGKAYEAAALTIVIQQQRARRRSGDAPEPHAGLCRQRVHHPREWRYAWPRASTPSPSRCSRGRLAGSTSRLRILWHRPV